jgi:hypothetical protein
MPNVSIPIPALSGIEEEREQTRKWITYVSLGGYLALLTIIIVLGWLILNLEVEIVLKVLTTTAGILSGIVGAIVGFYFRDQQSSS